MSSSIVKGTRAGILTRRLPSFIIMGAMKSGTTSIHSILNQHNRVFIPDREIHLFDIDDIEQHPDFFIETRNEWSFCDYEEKFDEYLSWYESFFRDAEAGQLIGEDSTAYMASSKATRRIAELLPNIKLIFMLRDPVMRAYSHYWHLINSGRTFYDFEKTIQYMPDNIIKRSFYKEQIARYKKVFPEKNMKFIIFESFVRDMQSTIDEICEFLGLEANIDIEKAHAYANKTAGLRSIRAQRLFNLVFRDLASQKYLQRLPNMPYQRPFVFLTILNKYLRRLNRTSAKQYPPMKHKTKTFLQKLFANENKGLSDLIDIDIGEYWTYFNG